MGVAMRYESEREIRARIEATRDRMGDTIEEIGDRVNPDRLQREFKARAREEVDEFKDNMKRKARNKMRDMEHEVADRGRGLWDTIRDNPIPAGMIGVGLAWLMASGSDRGGSERGYGEHRGYPNYPDRPTYRAYPSGVGRGFRPGHMESDEYGSRDGGHDNAGRIRDGAEHAADRVREGAEDAVDRVRDEARHAAEAAREKTSELAHRASEGWDEARDRAGELAHQAQYRARRVEHRVEDAVRDNPMAAGMVAAALGFAAGLMIPETRKEHELMGPARDRLLDRAQETAHRAADKAREVAKETASTAAEQAVDELWAGDDDNEPQGMSGPGRGI
jgi:ElaB/YqjD/DUF883 family membrane-anchored ribosome-binding protein